MTSADDDIDTRAEAVRNLRMAENELAQGGERIARAVRIEMHTRIAAVWSDLTPRAEAAPLAQASAPRVLPEDQVTRLWEGTLEEAEKTSTNAMGTLMEHIVRTHHEAPEKAPEPVSRHTPGQQWRDTAGDVWTTVGYLDRGDVLVISGHPEELADWPDVSPITEVDLFTLAHVEEKWGPLDEIETTRADGE